METWPCAACGRDRVDGACGCGEPGPVVVTKRFWSGRVFLSTESGTAEARRRRGVLWAEGRGLIRRTWRPPEGFARVTPGSAHLCADDVAHDFWTQVLVAEGRALGSVPPTWDRLGFVLVEALLRQVALGQVRLVRCDSRRWLRVGDRRTEELVRFGAGWWCARTAEASAEGIEGLWLTVLGTDPEPLAPALARLVQGHPQDVPHGWLVLASPPPSSDAALVWKDFISSDAEAVASLLRDVFVGLGLLAAP